ncbi:Ribosomal protein L7a [Entamoeba marina]
MKAFILIVLLCVIAQAKHKKSKDCLSCKQQTKRMESHLKKLEKRDKLNSLQIAAMESTFVLPEIEALNQKKKVQKKKSSKKCWKPLKFHHKKTREPTKAEIEKATLMENTQTTKDTNPFVKAMDSYIKSLKPKSSDHKVVKKVVLNGDKCKYSICKELNKKLKFPKAPKDTFKRNHAITKEKMLIEGY